MAMGTLKAGQQIVTYGSVSSEVRIRSERKMETGTDDARPPVHARIPIYIKIPSSTVHPDPPTVPPPRSHLQHVHPHSGNRSPVSCRQWKSCYHVV